MGTNFEYVRDHSPLEATPIYVSQVQEELFAKALLGKHDRKIYVPGHTY